MCVFVQMCDRVRAREILIAGRSQVRSDRHRGSRLSLFNFGYAATLETSRNHAVILTSTGALARYSTDELIVHSAVDVNFLCVVITETVGARSASNPVGRLDNLSARYV